MYVVGFRHLVVAVGVRSLGKDVKLVVLHSKPK